MTVGEPHYRSEIHRQITEKMIEAYGVGQTANDEDADASYRTIKATLDEYADFLVQNRLATPSAIHKLRDFTRKALGDD